MGEFLGQVEDKSQGWLGLTRVLARAKLVHSLLVYIPSHHFFVLDLAEVFTQWQTVMHHVHAQARQSI